ncbi:uncharacterized protein LOC105636244 [Jatropha curcas]|uniref:uncharacterized protein LOC105636244 n=1 Tax=Jatropha curcas TaxID=180498 RepID=UPI0005FAAF5B|nr:uncharacterized protein LOC105636244 [Jatropha curcas]
MKEDTSGSRDTTKYCEFHRDAGHETEACWQLKKEIECLKQKGKLKEFVGQTQEVTIKRDKQSKECHTLGTIHTIFKGLSGKNNNSGQKRRARDIYSILPQRKPGTRPPISFSEADGEHVHTLHNDALVIEGILENFLAKRILIDEGKPVQVPGSIDLTLELGTEGTSRKLKAKFMVADIHFPYNSL